MNKREYYCQQIFEYVRGYDVRKITMEDIAEQLGITKRTLYNYFDDKASMMRQVMDHHIKSSMSYLESSMLNPSRGNPIITLMTIVELGFDTNRRESIEFVRSVNEYYPDLFRHCADLNRGIIRDYLRQNISNGRDQNLYRDDFDVQIISDLVFMIVDNVRDMVLDEEMTCDAPRETLKQSLFCVLRGIVTEEGRSVLENEIKRIDKKR